MECPLESSNGAEVIVAYAAGRLAPHVEFALEQHLEACEKCRQLAEAQREVWSALDAWTPQTISANFNDGLYARIAAEGQNSWWRRVFQGRWSWRPAMPVAAACAALIAAFLLRNPVTQSKPVSMPSQTPQIEQVERALEDMDMLKELGVTTSREEPPAQEKI